MRPELPSEAETLDLYRSALSDLQRPAGADQASAIYNQWRQKQDSPLSPLAGESSPLTGTPAQAPEQQSVLQRPQFPGVSPEPQSQPPTQPQGDTGTQRREGESMDDYFARIRAMNAGDFKAGVMSGAHSLAGLGAGALAWAGDAVGSDTIRDFGVKHWRQAEENAQPWTEGRTTQLDQIKLGEEGGIGRAVDFAQYGLGTVVPSIAETLAAGLVGGVVGSAAGPAGTVGGGATGLATRLAGKKVFNRMLEKRFAEQLAQQGIKREAIHTAEKAALDKASNAAVAAANRQIGQWAGTFAAGYQMGLGDTYTASIADGSTDGNALVAGIAAPFYAAADTILEGSLLTGGLKRTVAQLTQGKKALGSAVGRMTAEGAMAGVTGGLSEAAQELIVMGVENTTRGVQFTPDEIMNRVGTAFAIGGIAGGGLGAISGATGEGTPVTGEQATAASKSLTERFAAAALETAKAADHARRLGDPELANAIEESGAAAAAEELARDRSLVPSGPLQQTTTAGLARQQSVDEQRKPVDNAILAIDAKLAEVEGSIARGEMDIETGQRALGYLRELRRQQNERLRMAVPTGEPQADRGLADLQQGQPDAQATTQPQGPNQAPADQTPGAPEPAGPAGSRPPAESASDAVPLVDAAAETAPQTGAPPPGATVAGAETLPVAATAANAGAEPTASDVGVRKRIQQSIDEDNAIASPDLRTEPLGNDVDVQTNGGARSLQFTLPGTDAVVEAYEQEPGKWGAWHKGGTAASSPHSSLGMAAKWAEKFLRDRAVGATNQPGVQQPNDILNANGKPFSRRQPAVNRAKAEGLGEDAVVRLGDTKQWVIRRSDVQPNQAQIRLPKNQDRTAGNQTSAQPAGVPVPESQGVPAAAAPASGQAMAVSESPSDETGDAVRQPPVGGEGAAATVGATENQTPVFARNTHPEVAQPTALKAVTLKTKTLNGEKRVKAKEYALPGYKGPSLAVAQYKLRGKTGYRVYLTETGELVEDSNTAVDLNSTLKTAVQRVSSAIQKGTMRVADAQPAQKPTVAKTETVAATETPAGERQPDLPSTGEPQGATKKRKFEKKTISTDGYMGRAETKDAEVIGGYAVATSGRAGGKNVFSIFHAPSGKVIFEGRRRNDTYLNKREIKALAAELPDILDAEKATTLDELKQDQNFDNLIARLRQVRDGTEAQAQPKPAQQTQAQQPANAPAKTGEPISLYYSRNTESAANNAPIGQDMGQDIEPAGEYVLVDTAPMKAPDAKWETGKIAFNNPLVLEHKNTGPTGWKRDLSQQFGGKTGAALSDAIRAAGHDAVITYDKFGFSEVVNLGGEKGRQSAAAPAEQAAGETQAAALGLYKDGIIGEEIPPSRVPNGNDAFQYAVGVTEEGGAKAVFRRRADERGTYGGWRYETDVAKLLPEEDIADAQAMRAQDGETRYSVDPTAKLPSAPRTSLPAARLQTEAESYVSSLLGPAADLVSVRVVQSQDEAMGPASRDQYGIVNAYFDPQAGEVVLVADNIPNMRQARRIIRHEAVAHFGWSALSDEAKTDVAARIKAAAKVNPTLKSLWDEEAAKDRTRTNAVVAEEVFARVTEDVADGFSGRAQAAWDRVLTFLRDAMAKLGLISPETTPAEMRVLARRMMAAMREGRMERGKGGDVRFSAEGQSILSRLHVATRDNKTGEVTHQKGGIHVSTFEDAKKKAGVAMGSPIRFEDGFYDPVSKRFYTREEAGALVGKPELKAESLNDNQLPATIDVDGVRRSTANPDIRFSLAGDVKSLLQRKGTNSNDPYARQNARIKEQDKTLAHKAKLALRRALFPGGNLPKPVFDAKIVRDSDLGVTKMDTRSILSHFEDAFAEEYGKTARKATQDEIDKLNAALRTPDDLGTLKPKTRARVLAMREYIGQFSERIANLLERQIADLEREAVGMTSQEAEALLLSGSDVPEAQRLRAVAAKKKGTLEAIYDNMDEYVHRSYQAFDDKNWYKRVPDDAINNARAFIAQERELFAQELDERSQMASADGDTDKATALRERAAELRDPQRVENELNAILKAGTAYSDVISFLGESKLGAMDLTIFRKRKDIPVEIRELWGEHKDPRLNFARTVAKQSRFVENQLFLERVKEIGQGDWLFDKRDDAFGATTQIPASDSYSPIEGMWTTPEIAQAFEDATGREQLPDWYRAAVRVNGMVKWGKTIGSPTTQARNFMSATFFAIANGHFDFRHGATAAKAFGEYLHSKDEGKFYAYLRKLKKLGVVYDTPYAEELKKLLDDSEIADTLAAGHRAELTKWTDLAQRVYSYSDDFWKLIGFENEKAINMKYKGMTEAEAEVAAAERIRNTYPTYSMTGRFVNQLRRFPLAGTFVSFPSEIIRTTYHVLNYAAQDMKDPALRPLAIRRLMGIALASGATYGAQALMMAALGVDDDEEEAFREMAAPWQRNSNILPVGRDADGSLRFVDLSFVDAYNFWKRPINAILRDEPWKDRFVDAGREVLEPFFGPDIMAGAIFEVMKNEKVSGARVFNPQDGVVQQTGDILGHLGNAAQPGVTSTLGRLYKALDGQVSPSGKEYTLLDEGLGAVGFRVSTFDAKTALYYKSFEFQDQKRDASEILNSVMRNPNKVSERELRGAFNRSLRARRQAYEDMATLVAAAEASGLSRAKTMAALRGSGISAEDRRALMGNTIPAWKLPRTTLRNADRKARMLFNQEVANEIRQRGETIRRMAGG